MTMTNPADAYAHFARKLAVETDPADVHAALDTDTFTLVDVRSPQAYAAGHLPGAVNLPHADIAAGAELPPGPLVVYCWSPACNGADKGALAVAGRGREVKMMLGGYEYWTREGRPTETA